MNLTKSLTCALPSEQLLSELDVPGPRYTSYPTADRFSESIEAGVYARALQARQVGGLSRPVSLYVHIPFCESVCYYCACNKVVTKDKSRSAGYLHTLIKEMDLVCAQMEAPAHVQQLHLGGGTPTFFSDEELELLVHALETRFMFGANAERSIEVDPRTIGNARLAHLRSLGFNRISFGVQDLDPAVQKAVHRMQGKSHIQALMNAARGAGFQSINVDLMYGLPLQTTDTLNRTLHDMRVISPDRIALYGYAHLPERFKPQRRIHAEQLPNAVQRIQLLHLAIETLTDAGYEYIGMDHFAKPSDELAKAKRQGRLHRNFQGYSTQPECDVIALGVSAIGRVGAGYFQNTRDLSEYTAMVEQGTLATVRGHVCSADDLVRHSVIMSLMCQGAVHFNDVKETHWVDFKSYFADELHACERLQAMGLLTLTAESIELTATGWYVVRNIAMVFDRYLQSARRAFAYSKTV